MQNVADAEWDVEARAVRLPLLFRQRDLLRGMCKCIKNHRWLREWVIKTLHRRVFQWEGDRRYFFDSSAFLLPNEMFLGIRNSTGKRVFLFPSVHAAQAHRSAEVVLRRGGRARPARQRQGQVGQLRRPVQQDGAQAHDHHQHGQLRQDL